MFCVRFGRTSHPSPSLYRIELHSSRVMRESVDEKNDSRLRNASGGGDKGPNFTNFRPAGLNGAHLMDHRAQKMEFSPIDNYPI